MIEQVLAEQLEQPQRRRRTGARKLTLSQRRASKTELRHLRVLNEAEAHAFDDRPLERRDCQAGGINAERPCPWAGCRYHLALDVQRNGGLTLNFPDRDIEQLDATCALDVAERGGLTLEQVAALMNLTRERVRQVEDLALLGLSDELLMALQEVRRDG